jgi:hypothetical protein
VLFKFVCNGECKNKKQASTKACGNKSLAMISWSGTILNINLFLVLTNKG